ncbi:MAG: hypothetical protein JST49_10720 [Bacteroidetes bacterium]|nr:hypothetical protein [Bacteroidota bacterium]
MLGIRRTLQKYKAWIGNLLILRSAKVWKQNRAFYFQLFLKEYDTYQAWIEPIATSTLPIDIIIPAIEKDLMALPYVIEAARKYIKHPIGNIYIVAPNTPAIRACAQAAQCEFVNEIDVCNTSKAEIDFVVNGVNRSGWIYQQLLKFNFIKVGSCTHHLVLDADTVFVKDIVFENGGKYFFDFADEYHTPYYRAYEMLTGLTHTMPISFVSHYMLFSKQMLQNLKEHIETHTAKSVEHAIIDLKLSITDQSNFSEYETYANFCIAKAPQKYSIRYWFNKSCKIEELAKLPLLERSDKWRSISFHAYNN